MRLFSFLAVFLLSFGLGMHGNAYAAPVKVYRLGFPQDHNAMPYKWLIDGLEQKGLVVGKNLEIVYVDIDNYHDEAGRAEIRRELAEKCDLFFCGGSFLEILFKVGPHTPLLFMNVAGSDRMIPAEIRANTTGVRIGTESGIFKQAVEMLQPDKRNKMGMIYFKDSKLGLMASGFQKTCKALGFELVVKEYAGKDNIASVMQDFKEEGVGGIILFPPSYREGELQELIHWQNKLKLPLIGLIGEDVEKGLLGGPTIDYKLIKPSLADYAIKIMQGRNPGQLPVRYFSPQYVVNLATASRLKIAVPTEVVSRAEIVGLATQASKEDVVQVPLVQGNFVVGVPRNTSKQTLESVITSLSHRGYVLGSNLRLEVFDINLMENEIMRGELVRRLNEKTNVVFANGNLIGELARLRGLKTPICFVSTKETTTTIPDDRKQYFTGVVRASFGSIVEFSRQVVPEAKRLALLGRKGSKLPSAMKRYQKIAASYGVTMDEYRLFENTEEIGPLMQELRKNNEAMLLFSPGLTQNDIMEIVEWQYRLEFPVLAQFERDVRAGLLAGTVVDMEKIGPKLAEYIDKLMHGRAADQLPLYYYPGKIYINLRTANKLKRDIPTEITSRAEIIR